MNKQDFIKIYRTPKITVLFDDGGFLTDNSVVIKERVTTLNEVDSYYCPWYYDQATGKEISQGFEEILKNPLARAVMIKDVKSKIKSKSTEIAKYAEDFKEKTEKSLRPFPVATDTACLKSLVLDGNKTLAALYQSWERNKKIPIVEIVGANLSRILPDFYIVLRS